MSTHSIAEARNKLPELIDRALKGENVVITQDDVAAVELKPVSMPVATKPRPITDADIDWLDKHRIGRLSSTEDAGTLVSRMRDEDDERLSRR